MAINLIKLCVGVENLEQLLNWQQRRGYKYNSDIMAVNHVTRNFPKRGAELIDGGSLYWVIKGKISARNEIVALEETQDSNGKRACSIVLKTPFVATEPKPHRPFQGWRYFNDDRKPEDIIIGGKHGDIPQDMLFELRELGLL